MNERFRSVEPINEKKDCEVLLLTGLTGSGKTTWAKKHIEDNPNKLFNLLNIENVLNKMKVRQIVCIFPRFHFNHSSIMFSFKFVNRSTEVYQR